MGKVILGYKNLRNKCNGEIRAKRVPIYDDWFDDIQYCSCGNQLKTEHEQRENMCRECV